jgi:hypothetical protein
VRSLIQKAIVKPDDKTMIESLGSAMKSLKAMAAYAERMPCPNEKSKINQQRVLALKLLAQAVSGIQIFVASADEDALAGARIDLGEAIRNAAEVKVAESSK